MLTPNNNGKIEIDISAKEKYAINVDLVEDSFEVDAIPSSEQKQINLDNYLSIDNEKPYTPTGDYNPSTKKYIDDIIKNFKSLNIEKVNTLEEVTDAQTIYLIPSLTTDGTNGYEEYILVDGVPECLGVTKAEVARKQNRLITGENVSIVDDVISAKGGVEPKRGEELALMEEPFTGVAFCTEGYGEDFLEGSMYEYEDGVLIKTIELSGGGAGNTNQSITITPLEDNVAVGNPVLLEYEFKSKASGKGTAKLLINGVLKSSKIISKGINSFDITEFVKEGTNFFTVTITDSSNSTITFDYIINGVKLTLKTTFNESNVYTGEIPYTYTVIGAGLKTVTFVLDNEEIGSVDIRSTGEQSKYMISGLSHGAHILKVKATTMVGEVLIESNELVSQILFAEDGVMTPIVSSSFSKTEAIEGELLAIDYIIYDPAGTTATAYLQVNEEEPTIIQVDRTKHYWNIAKYPVGDVIFKIGCGGVFISLPVTVTKLEMDIEPVEDDLSLYLSAANRSNAELEGVREIWAYNDITCELTNLNWVSNGWLNNTLKLTGESTGYIPLNIFGSDPKATGKTIEIEFATHNIKNYDSVLLSCYTENKGIQITATEAFLKSEQETVKVRFKEDEKTRVSYVIESGNDNRLIRTYVNGILSGIAQYDASDNFQQGAPIGITLNEGKEEIDIYTIRVYDIALSSRQVLNNYICDLTDISEKIAKYQANNVYDIYGSISMAKIKSMIPILTITGPLPPVKGEKQTVNVTYADPLNPSLDFSQENCTIDIQGTSSQYYPKKNYKIKFNEAFSFYEGAIPEKEYTFKADYMESSHSHNTGNAILVNSLYTEMFPTQTKDNGVRNTIYGFPCAIYYRASAAADYEYFGAYNFNNDKGNSDTLGLVGAKAQSWEFKNNTSTHCLLRNDDFSPEAKPEDDFEARYPDKYTDYTDLQRVVSWIVSTDGDLAKFKNEFNQYFNLHYCLIYYVMLEWGLMMDSRAKNMFFDTIDGNIWYPRMYDMDTCYGLNNEGVLNFGYGLEQHDENIYNGENSLFWNNFEQVYEKEIKDMYLSLRSSGKLSYDNMMMIFKQNQIDKICEAQYNEDAQFKYLSPVIEDNDTTYLYAAQGSRESHFQWWVTNRIKYLDSKYEAADYLADFITMRMYTDEGTFKVTPYIDQYLKIRYGSADVKVRGKAGEETVVPCPTGLVFNDTETIIYGANGISEIGDLSPKYPGTVDVSKGLKLAALKIGDSTSGYENPHLTTLTLGNNKLLRTIDVSNCPNLVGNLNVEGCTALREFKAMGSGLKGITFVDGGDLETLELPLSLTNLTIKNHANLLSIKPSKFADLQTLILKNSKLNASDLVSANYRNLTRVYCIFEEEANVELSTYIMDHLLENCNGVDDNGLNTEYPNIQGYLTINYPNTFSAEKVEQMKNRYANAFPYLNITYKPIKNFFTYNSSNNRIEFPVLNENLPAVAVIPNRDQIEEVLGLAAGTIKDTTTFYSSNTSDSNYKNTLKQLVLPEGYASYYINMEYYDNIETIVMPKSYTKITYFALNDSNSPYAKKVEELDFSAENIDLSSCTYLRFNPREGSLKKFSIEGKTIKNSLANSTSSTGSTFANILYRSSSSIGSPVEEINFNNITVDTVTKYFGCLNDYNYNYPISTKGYKFIGTNMQLLTTTRFNPIYLGDAEELDFSNSYMPNVTEMYMYHTSSGSTDLQHLKTIKLNNIIAPKLTNMSTAFAYHKKLEKVELKDFDTSKVTTMASMFLNCEKLNSESVDFTALNTESVTTMADMFDGCKSMEEYPNISSFNTEKVTTMKEMFHLNSKLKSLNLTGWKVPKLTTVKDMVSSNPEIETFEWKDSNSTALTDMSSMFNGDNKLKTVNLENFNTSAVQNFGTTFNGNTSLEDLNLDIDFSAATTTENMFNGCQNLKQISFVKKDAPYLTSMAYMFRQCKNLEEVDLSELVGNNVSNINSMFQECDNLRELKMDNFLGSKVTDATSLLEKCKNLEVVNLGLNSQLVSMGNMFNDCTNLRELRIPNLDTSAVTNMSYTFANNPNLKILEVGDNFSTQSATNLSNMFANSPLVNLPLDKISTGNAVSLAGMFKGHPITEEDLAIIRTWDTSKVTNVNSLFSDCNLPETVDLSGMTFGNLGDCGNLFANNPKVRYVNVDNVVLAGGGWNFLASMMSAQMEKIDFTKCTAPASYSWIITGTGHTINVFPGLTNLREFKVPNLSLSLGNPSAGFLKDSVNLEALHIGSCDSNYYYYESSNWKYSSLFSGKTKLRDAYLGRVTFKTAYTNLASLFSGCTSLETWDLNNMDTALNNSIYAMFQNCKALTHIDLSWMKTPSVTSMANLFNGCSSLTSFNIDGFNYNQVTTIAYMFANCSSLKTIKLKIADAPVLTNATYLFSGDTSLERVDLTEADLSLITSASYMFNGCSSLKTLDLSYLNISKVTNFSYMFKSCSALEELDLSCINSTSNANVISMFHDCAMLKKLDIRNWQINKCTSNISNIFTNVPASCQIIVKDEACRTWVKARKSAFTNVVLASEL